MEEVLAADGKESSGSVLSDEIEMDTDLIHDRTYLTSTGEGGVDKVTVGTLRLDPGVVDPITGRSLLGQITDFFSP